MPQIDKAVCIVAPHTTNWDFVFLVAYKFVHKIKVRWIGKDSMFKWPFGWFFRMLGGVPIDRSSPQNAVQQIANTFDHSERMLFALSPEGTRSYTDHWKSGFYHIAKAAKVPILMAYIDYKGKRLGIHHEMLWLSSDMKADMDRIRAFYGDKLGKYPEKMSWVVLKGE